MVIYFFMQTRKQVKHKLNLICPWKKRFRKKVEVFHLFFIKVIIIVAEVCEHRYILTVFDPGIFVNIEHLFNIFVRSAKFQCVGYGD